MSLEWSPAFSVGVDELDRDHIALMSKINEIEGLIGNDGALRRALDEYSRQMQRHATREVGVLRRYGYEKHHDMAEAHAELAALLDKFIKTSGSGDIAEAIRTWLDYQDMWMKVLTSISMDYRKFFMSKGIIPVVES